MKWKGAVLAITIIFGVVFASGCLNFLSPIGTSKPGTQTTQPPVGTPPPPTGGGGSGSGCDCDRHAFVKELKSDIDDPIDSVEYHLAETLTTSCFHLISHKASIGGESLKPTNPQPEEYYFNANFAKNLGGTFNKYGTEYKSRLTINLFFNGNPEELVKTLTTDGTNNDWNAHNNLMFDNKDAVINQIKPIDEFLKDYERMPVSGQITPSKDEVNPGETIDVTVDSLKDSQGRAPKSFQRILVKAENGIILGGTESGEYKVFKATDSSIKFQYKAPDKCDKETSDTITIYNSCDIADKYVPLTVTSPKDQIGITTINIQCQNDGTISLYNVYEGTGNRWSTKGTIPFTIKDYKNGIGTIVGSGNVFFDYSQSGSCEANVQKTLKATIKDGKIRTFQIGTETRSDVTFTLDIPHEPIDYTLTCHKQCHDWDDKKGWFGPFYDCITTSTYNANTIAMTGEHRVSNVEVKRGSKAYYFYDCSSNKESCYMIVIYLKE